MKSCAGTWTKRLLEYACEMSEMKNLRDANQRNHDIRDDKASKATVQRGRMRRLKRQTEK